MDSHILTQKKGIGEIIFTAIHIVSILSVIIGACLIGITNEVLIYSAIACGILTIVGALFVYDNI